MTALLPILDNFERSIMANNYSEDEGPVLIFKQLKSELEKKGLKEMDDPIGKELDTEFHEAITDIPATSKKLKGKIFPFHFRQNFFQSGCPIYGNFP